MLPTLMLASIRPGAAFLAAPVFGAAQVPVLLRFILAIAVGVPGSGLATIVVPADGLFGLAGVALVLGEVVIGLAMGFALQLGFASAAIAGEAMSNAMGLGFAATIDPMSGAGTPAIAQFMTILATLLFLSMDGHLIFVAVIAHSYSTLPIGGGLISADAVGAIMTMGSAMFAASVVIALPVVTGVVLVQLVMAVLARSAPALNLFAVGLPAALLGGVILFAYATPAIGQAITRTLVANLDDMAVIAAR